MKPGSYTAEGVTHKTLSIRADYIRKIAYTAAQEEQEEQENQDAEPVSQRQAKTKK